MPFRVSLATSLRRLSRRKDALKVGLLVIIVVGFSLLKTEFTSTGNLYALMQTAALLGLVSLGLSLTMIAGEFDLSVGAMVAVAGLITLKLGTASAVGGVAIAAGIGVAVGVLNALIFVWLKVSSLIITLGTMITLSGVGFWMAGGKVVSSGNFDAGVVLDTPLLYLFSLRSLFTLATYLGVYMLMGYTRLGRDVVATGSKRSAATASGARVGLALTLVFSLSALFAAVAGSFLALSLATASATMGANLLLQAVSAAIIGGVALSGGVGNAAGVLVGVLILAALNNGLGLLGASSSAILFANGIVLLSVVLLEGGGNGGAHSGRLFQVEGSTFSGGD